MHLLEGLEFKQFACHAQIVSAFHLLRAVSERAPECPPGALCAQAAALGCLRNLHATPVIHWDIYLRTEARLATDQLPYRHQFPRPYTWRNILVLSHLDSSYPYATTPYSQQIGNEREKLRRKNLTEGEDSTRRNRTVRKLLTFKYLSNPSKKLASSFGDICTRGLLDPQEGRDDDVINYLVRINRLDRSGCGHRGKRNRRADIFNF